MWVDSLCLQTSLLTFSRYNDLEDAIREIGHFLGGRAAEIVNDVGQLERVVAASRIDAMKENQSRWFSLSLQ